MGFDFTLFKGLTKKSVTKFIDEAEGIRLTPGSNTKDFIIHGKV